MSKELSKKSEETALAAPMDEMFGGKVQMPVDATLPIIKILRESPMFELPGGEVVKDITGHILYWHNANQYYNTAFGEDQGPPTCTSSDGVMPDGGEQKQAQACRGCSMNQYKSAGDGKGKACQNQIRMYLLLDGEVIPCQLRAAPSSLGRKDSLMTFLVSAANIASKAGIGTNYQPIKVKLSLHKKDFVSGFSASVIDVAPVRVLTMAVAEDAAHVKKLAALYRDFMANYMSKIKDNLAGEHQVKEGDDCPI